jgi:imidazolonepropionase-like amidohydrolase
MTGFAPGILERGPDDGVADGAEEIQKAVRYQIKHGAKWIKMCATGGILSYDATVGAQQYSESELRAGVDEAARHGLRVAVHAHGTEEFLLLFVLESHQSSTARCLMPRASNS